MRVFNWAEDFKEDVVLKEDIITAVRRLDWLLRERQKATEDEVRRTEAADLLQ